MRTSTYLLLFGFVTYLSVAMCAERPANLPVYFEENRGQFTSELKYSGRAGGLTIGVKSTGTTLRLAEGKHMATVEMQLRGADTESEVRGEALTENRSNYFIGKDESLWKRDIPNFLKVRQSRVYPGIDAVFYGNEQRVEYDFVVAPGADVSQIAWAIRGAASVSLDREGQLHIRTAAGEILEHPPLAYQMVGDSRRAVKSRFRLKNGLVSFELGKYDHDRELVIDPVITYSSYLGGSTNDSITGMALDSSGAMYVTGTTSSSDFPTTAGAYKTTSDSYYYAFVTKVAPAGNTLSYSTYLGPVDYSTANLSIAVDNFGGAYIAGSTSNSLFPTTSGAYKTTPNIYGYQSIFVARLTPTGNALSYSTLLGQATASSIAVDPSQQIAYVLGTSGSPSYPTTAGAYQPAINSNSVDAVITAVNPQGNGLVFSTFLGGSGSEFAAKILLDSLGQPIVTGTTTYTGTAKTSDFPVTAGAFSIPFAASQKAFLTKLSQDGTKLVFSTLFGGSGSDGAWDFTLDTSNNIYLTGSTTSSDLPVSSSAYDQSTENGYIAKLSADGKSILYLTYWSTYNYYYQNASPIKIAVDPAGRVIAGQTAPSSFVPTYDAIQSSRGNTTISVLDAAGSYVSYATYFGMSSVSGIATDLTGNLYLAGTTSSQAFPTVNGFQTNAKNLFNNRGFYAKITMDNTVCFSNISTVPLSFSSDGGSGTMNVTAPAGCVWTSSFPNYNSFPAGVTNIGTVVGPAAITFTVPKNYSNTPRSMSIQVGNQTVQILQASAPCVLSLSPSNAPTFPGGGGISNIFGSIPSGCTWNFISDSSWVVPTIYNGNYYYSNSTSAFGSAAVRYVAAANNGPARTATLTLGGVPITISQQAGTSTVSTTSFSFDSNAGTGSFSVMVDTGVKWSATPFDPWVTITSGAAGTGPGTVNFSVAANSTGVVRVSAISVANQAVSVTQRQTTTLFSDIGPSSAYFDGANLLRTLGITAGCGVNPLKFCPDDSVTKGQMAVFVVRAVMGGDSFSYTTTPYFADVPATHAFFPWIQKLADLGYATSCSATTYCPETPQTRGGAATVLIKARWTGLSPYFYYYSVFTDVPYTDTNAPYIQALRDEGITAGCSVTQFCPLGTLTRGQAAILLVRALYNQLLPGNSPIITAVLPKVLTRGQTVSVTITGINTLIYPNLFTLGNDITFGAATATTATSITLPVTVAATALVGPRSIVNGYVYSNPTNVLIGPNMVTIQ